MRDCRRSLSRVRSSASRACRFLAPAKLITSGLLNSRTNTRRRRDMKPYLPLSVFVCVGLAFVASGPIAQFADYHHFADQRTFAGIPRAADVLSNVAFGVVALWGVAYLRRAP